MTDTATNVYLLTFDTKHSNEIFVYAREEDAESELATHRLEVMHNWRDTLLEDIDDEERAFLLPALDLPAGSAESNASLINETWDGAGLSDVTNDFTRVEAYRVQG